MYKDYYKKSVTDFVDVIGRSWKNKRKILKIKVIKVNKKREIKIRIQ